VDGALCVSSKKFVGHGQLSYRGNGLIGEQRSMRNRESFLGSLGN